MTKPFIGQTFWLVPGFLRRGDPCEATVTKVGRLYMEIRSNHGTIRVKLDGLIIDGGRWTLYQSREAYAVAKQLNAAWSDFCMRFKEVSFRRPSHIDLPEIAAIEAIIFPPVEP